MYRSCAFIKVSTSSNRWKFPVFKVLRIILVSVLIKYKNFNVTSILRGVFLVVRALGFFFLFRGLNIYNFGAILICGKTK